MSNLFGMIYTGVSGINAAQSGLDTVGHNIANMKNANYSRQSVSLVTNKPQYTYQGSMGRGVKVESINRAYDELLARSVRAEASSYSFYNSSSAMLKQAMLYFNELEQGSGLGDALKDYFNAWSSLASGPTDGSDSEQTKLYDLVEKARTLTSKIRDGYKSIEDVRNTADTTVKSEVEAINQITKSISDLNKQIGEAESAGRPANDLRDARDALVDRLSEKANITSYERENGQIAVFIGGQTIVDGGSAHLLEVMENPDKENHLDVYWRTENRNSTPINVTELITGGTIAAAIKTRDGALKGYMEDLNNLSKTIITATNRVHASGQGVERFSSISGASSVNNPKQVLASEAGKLPYDIKKGSFRITLYDGEGKAAGTFDIDVDPALDTLESMAAKISSAAGSGTSVNLTASLNADNSLRITAPGSYTLAFSDDNSDFLMAAGINAFFSGSGAADIDVAELIKDNPKYVATGKGGGEGDNTNAKAIADLQMSEIEGTNSLTISEFYGYFIGKMGTDKAQIDVFASTKKMAFNAVQTQLTSIRGVSENEELINMGLLQRTFEANSRFVNVVDEMLNTIINGLGAVGR